MKEGIRIKYFFRGVTLLEKLLNSPMITVLKTPMLGQRGHQHTTE